MAKRLIAIGEALRCVTRHKLTIQWAQLGNAWWRRVAIEGGYGLSRPGWEFSPGDGLVQPPNPACTL